MPLSKPSSCAGCALATRGFGYAPADGPETAEILFVGEALGSTEAAVGRPFVGDAGGMLQRLLNMLGWARESIRIDNCVRCRPVNDWLEGAPWQYDALNHCRQYLGDSLASPYLKVVVPLGGVALRQVLQLTGKKIKVADFHGTITRDPSDRFWVVPTFHPSFLQRGAHNLIGTVLWDLQQAQQAAQVGKAADPGTLVVDPPVEWFSRWVDQVAQTVREAPHAYPLSCDVETPDKAHGRDEGEITTDDRSYTILRVNVACHPDEGITVPFVGPYVDHLRRLLGLGVPLWLWNKEYDVPRLTAAEVLTGADDARCLDLMWLWHFLQSDLPRGLGFVAPFYSGYGPWKHLSDADPAGYGAIDGLQTHRLGFGIIGDLRRLGMYESAFRHVHQLHALVLKPAQIVGVPIDRDRLLTFKADLGDKATRLLGDLQDIFPADLKNLSPKGGLTKRPADNVLHVKASAFTRKGTARKGKAASEIKLDLYKQATIIEREVEKEVWVCTACGQIGVPRRHACATRKQQGGDVQLETRSVVRYFWAEPFNPDSWQQVLAYIKWKGDAPGKAKKTHKETTNKETLDRLSKSGDPFYQRLLDYRAVQKVKGTYVDGTERRLDADSRVHPQPTFKPSTGRLSYVDPNITNVVADKDGDSLASGFRRCVVAGPGCRLLEVDFAGSEAVDVGWCSRDPSYIRLAKLGVHAGLASHILKRPYDPAWSDADLGAYFKTLKKAPEGSIEKITYDRAKRFVHGYSYGLTLRGMTLQFPEIFPTMKIAEHYAELFTALAPAVPTWQRTTRELAHRQHYLGGPGAHPFGYKHWFWSVFTLKKISVGQYYAILQKLKRKGIDETDAPVAVFNGQYFRISLGEDGKRCVAFMPQSITAGKIKTAMLRLFDPEAPSYIGETYFGRTPLRAPIHDSLLLEIPNRVFDTVASLVVQEMQKPFLEMPCPVEWGLGPYLATGVSAKVGSDWASMEDLALGEIGVSTDRINTAALAEDDEDLTALGREVA